MKKFSVLLVAILALMMLFVSCENEPKERVATMKDGEIIIGLFMSSGMVPVDGETVIEVDEYTTEFKKAEYKEGGKVVAVLNGTTTYKPEESKMTCSLNFGDGTKYKDEDHTLLANIVVKLSGEGDPVDVDSSEIMLDGVIIKDFVFDFLFEKP